MKSVLVTCESFNLKLPPEKIGELMTDFGGLGCFVTDIVPQKDTNLEIIQVRYPEELPVEKVLEILKAQGIVVKESNVLPFTIK